MLGKKLSRISVFLLVLVFTLTIMPSAAFAYNDVAEQEMNISGDSGKLIDTTISDISLLSKSNQLSIPQNSMMSTNSDNGDPGFYVTISDYLEVEGSNKYLYPIRVEANEVLHAQANMPNSSQIDYDLYLYEVDENGGLTLVDYSNYTTLINGSYGTVPEAVGIYNTSGVYKEYALFVSSYVGASSTMPFTVHLGIDANTETAEADENAMNATGLSLPTNNKLVVNTRAMNTLCDNDWFYLDVTSIRNYDTIAFSMDSTSVSSGYKLELFNLVNGGLSKVSLNNGELNVSSGLRYFIRVSSAGASGFVGSDYTLTIAPEYYADEVIITGYGSTDTATYDGTTRTRVDGGTTITVYGRARAYGINLPNAQVKITVENPSWSADSQRFRSTTVTTDNYGYFAANITLENAVGDYSTLVGSAIKSMHYWDYGIVYGQSESGSVLSDPDLIYIFAYSVYIG